MRLQDAEKRLPLVAGRVQEYKVQADADREDERLQRLGRAATGPLETWFKGMQKIEEALKGRSIHIRTIPASHQLGAGVMKMRLTQSLDRDPFNIWDENNRENWRLNSRRLNNVLATTVYFQPDGESLVQPLDQEVIVKIGHKFDDEKKDNTFPEELCAAYEAASTTIEPPAGVAPEKHAARVAANGTVTWLPFYVPERNNHWGVGSIAAAQQRFEPVRASLAGTYDTLIEGAQHPKLNPGLDDILSAVYLRDISSPEVFERP